MDKHQCRNVTFNLNTHTFSNFYADDGLQGNEFSKTPLCRPQRHTLVWRYKWNYLFQSSRDYESRKKWNVRIIDFYLHDQPIRKGMLSGGKEIINTSVFEARDFHLSHNDNAFSIEFSTRELNNSERITYLYTINNTPWVKLPKGVNRVSFSDLPPAIIISGSKPKIICWNPTPMKSPFTSHRHGGHRAGPC